MAKPSDDWPTACRNAIQSLLTESMKGEPFIKEWTDHVQKRGEHFILLEDNNVNVPGMAEDYHFIEASGLPVKWKLSYDMFPGYVTMSWDAMVPDPNASLEDGELLMEAVNFVVFSIYPRDKKYVEATGADPQVVQVVGMYRSFM